LSTRTVSDLGERALIARITARLPLPSWLPVGPGDDAAVMEPVRGELDVLTTDAQVEGVHFDRRFVAAEAIGHRALAVNLSDLAAMGARPRAALLSLMLPDALTVADVDAVLDGLLALAAAHGVAVIGGNVTRSPGPLIVDVTAVGSIGRRRALTRGGARAGDEVYVTGTLGDAVVGLRSFQADLAGDPGPGPQRLARCRERYLRPIPRVRAGMMLARGRAASACIDLSDGLADGAMQVAAASQTGMLLDADALPIADETRGWFLDRGQNPAMAVVAGGDDYELLFTVRPAHRGRLRAARRLMNGLSVTRIGVITSGGGVRMRTAAGEQPLPQGFEHFTARHAGGHDR
jgi:thiamine-monophosphate kinase